MRTLDVDGISGEDVKNFLVSRDGSRLIAVIRDGADGDRIVVSRIVTSAEGKVVVPSRRRTSPTAPPAVGSGTSPGAHRPASPSSTRRPVSSSRSAPHRWTAPLRTPRRPSMSRSSAWSARPSRGRRLRLRRVGDPDRAGGPGRPTWTAGRRRSRADLLAHVAESPPACRGGRDPGHVPARSLARSLGLARRARGQAVVTDPLPHVRLARAVVGPWMPGACVGAAGLALARPRRGRPDRRRRPAAQAVGGSRRSPPPRSRAVAPSRTVIVWVGPWRRARTTGVPGGAGAGATGCRGAAAGGRSRGHRASGSVPKERRLLGPGPLARWVAS